MNVLYIHTHDSGRMLEPYGQAVRNPGFMNFARDALVFRQAYCAGPTCSPSRAALLTGMYPHSNGMLGLAQRGFSLQDYQQHLASFLKMNGYRPVLCGIQHEAGSYLDHTAGAQRIGYQDISAGNEGMREEDLVHWDWENAGRVSDWLRDHGKGGRFFLAYGMFATHRKYPDQITPGIDPRYIVPPYPAPDTPANREDHARYLTSAGWFDRCFDRVIQTLKETGLYENTIIISTTDHGVALPYSKCTLYDTGIGVSFIMRVPGSPANGCISDALVSQVDVFPTLCEVLGIRMPEWVQGKSFAGLFHEPHLPHRQEVFAEINFHTSYEPARCVRTRRFKYIRYFDSDYLGINFSNIDNSAPKSLLLENGLKQQTKPAEALYDLYHDPGERRNLAENAEYAAVLADMRVRLSHWMQSTDDPLLNGPIAVRPQWKVNRKTCLNPSSRNSEDYENLPLSGY